MRTETAHWSISEVAQMSRVSARTLRHYDRLGLLTPAFTAPNGYRYYGDGQLRRLQRILVLRELGLGLATIAEVLDGQADEAAALQVHHDWLRAERDRLDRLAATVAQTIHSLRQGESMNAKDLFTGFEDNPYEEEAIARWGREAVAEANTRVKALAPERRRAMAQEAQEINTELARCLAAGLEPDDDAVQAAVGRHYAWVAFYWTPDAASYVGLGQMYVDDPRFTRFYDSPEGGPARPGLAAYLLAGIRVYAARNLR